MPKSAKRVNLTQLLGNASKFAFAISGGNMVVDVEGFAQTFADELAAGIRGNLENGMRPDGKRAMPRRKETPDGRPTNDGRPRGLGSMIVSTIKARKTGTGFTIAADEAVRGHLRRILKSVTLKPSPSSPTWQAALDKAMGVLLSTE